MITVGKKVQCKPFNGVHLFGEPVSQEVIDGVIAHVNYDHRWFMVKYGENNQFRVCFNFHDLDKAVWLV